MIHKVGPSTDPWIQLRFTIRSLDLSFPHWTNCLLLVSQLCRHLPTLPFTPAMWHSFSDFPWSSRSKAFCRSKDQTSTFGPCSSVISIPFSQASSRFVWQPILGLKPCCCFETRLCLFRCSNIHQGHIFFHLFIWIPKNLASTRFLLLSTQNFKLKLKSMKILRRYMHFEVIESQFKHDLLYTTQYGHFANSEL